MITITLKPGREGPVRAGHPWVFSGAIAKTEGQGSAGSLATIVAADGAHLGTGYFNSACSIAVRMLSRSAQATDITPAFIRKRIENALRLRQTLLSPGITGYRLVNGEGDLLPGIIIDVYDRFLVLQCLTAGADRLQPFIVQAAAELLSPRGVYEKSEGRVRKEEGLVNRARVVWGEAPPSRVEIHEHGCRFLVHLQGGQKTGFFLDQRENRAVVGTLAAGKRVLNGFSYTGGFGIAAAKHGAQHVTSVDSAESALRLARQNWQLNDLGGDQASFFQADMFSYMQEIEEKFDIIILDPPPFIRRRHDTKAGIAGYKEINRRALLRLKPRGHLLTFSCSQHLPTQDFLQTVLFAATDARRDAQILRHLGPGVDHPVHLAHPQGTYLKGLWLRMGD